MSLASLLPLAGAAVAPALAKVIDGAAQSLSFLDVLHKQAQDGAVDGLADDAADAIQAAESSSLQQDVAELANRLRERFAQLGVDLTTPLRLKRDGRDRVVVDGDHPDRVLIEGIFGNDQELTKLFAAVAAAAHDGAAAADSGITTEFRFVVTHTDARIEFA